jgi:hypothetical protein
MSCQRIGNQVNMGPVEFIGKAKNKVSREVMMRARFLAYENRERRFAKHFEELEPATVPWLIAAERRYGGYTAGVVRNKVSPQDDRTESELRRGGMLGGDRMSAIRHNYADKYSQYLLPVVRSGPRSVLVEAGILLGSGVAMWSELFPDGRIIGLDIDLGHIQSNMKNLEARGAFKNGNLELHTFDQLEDNRRLLSDILGRDRVDVYIDDGLHTEASIMTSLASIRPYLAKRFVCFIEDIEDIDQVAKRIAHEYPDFQLDLDRSGLLTVITPRPIHRTSMSTCPERDKPDT